MNNHIFSDIGAMVGRTMKHTFRSVDSIITVAIMPILMMLLFVYVFGGAIRTEMENYVNYVLPGILLIAIASGIAYTSYRIFLDVQKGILTRFKTMPIMQASFLWGHVLTSVLANYISLAVIFLVALAIGFRTSASLGAWLIVFFILTLYILALTLIAAISGLAARSEEGATAFTYPLIFLPYISPAFVPTQTMPFALRVFAENQPVTSIIASVRALLAKQPLDNDIYLALAWCIGIAVVAAFFATRIFNRVR